MAAMESITKTLGSGSGIDIQALVASLVQAQYAGKTGQLTAKAETLTAQISGVAKLKGAITGFDGALKSLVRGGTLATQPSSSDTGLVQVSALAGGRIGALSSTLVVERLATAQAATTRTAIAADAGFAGGTLTVRLGRYVTDADGTRFSASKDHALSVAAGATLADIAAQIRTVTGLAATIVTDGDGVRLTIKGATGASQAFEIAGSDSGGSDSGGSGGGGGGGISLSTLAVGGGAGGLDVTTAQDAVVVLDGARFSRAGNSIGNLVPGVKLSLLAASATPVTLGTAAPGSALSQAVSDFVDTFNQMRGVLLEETNTVSGVLKADTAATAIARALGQLTTTRLAVSTTGGPQTLADLGVRTNRDGSLSVDAARLATVVARDPAGVEALFADGTGASDGGLSAAFAAVAGRLTDKDYGLDAATTRYTRQQGQVLAAQEKAGEAATAAATRMTQQFAAMDARVAAYRSTQAFLTQQIAAWNGSSD